MKYRFKTICHIFSNIDFSFSDLLKQGKETAALIYIQSNPVLDWPKFVTNNISAKVINQFQKCCPTDTDNFFHLHCYDNYGSLDFINLFDIKTMVHLYICQFNRYNPSVHHSELVLKNINNSDIDEFISILYDYYIEYCPKSSHRVHFAILYTTLNNLSNLNKLHIETLIKLILLPDFHVCIHYLSPRIKKIFTNATLYEYMIKNNLYDVYTYIEKNTTPEIIGCMIMHNRIKFIEQVPDSSITFEHELYMIQCNNIDFIKRYCIRFKTNEYLKMLCSYGHIESLKYVLSQMKKNNITYFNNN